MTLPASIAKVGSGPKTWRDLTWEEAKQAMRALIEGQASPVQVGALLMALRLKSESVTELAAFTAAAREYVAPLPVQRREFLVDLPSYAGKEDTFHAAVAAAIVAAAAGGTILMHGYEGRPGRIASAIVLSKLGIPSDLRPPQAAEMVDQFGFAYLDIALYHPPIARFLDLRQQLGVRTSFHPVARLLNPARAGSQVIGVSHPPYFEKTAEALRMLGAGRALVIRGVEGEPELSIAGVTKVLELRDERITPFSLQPKDVGLATALPNQMAGFPADHIEKECELLARILGNQIRGGGRDWVAFNAALLLYAGGKGASLASCLPLAHQVIESGAAARTLKALQSARQPAQV
jgi:anthranilate phosphoribosyltransferase